MSLGRHGHYGGVTSKGARLQSKVGQVITVERLEELLGKREPIPEAKVIVSKPVKRSERGW